ncbi:hypothetical protein ACOSP7_014537 [Xanthoceras sorbifolium]
MKQILQVYGEASGQIINFSKSAVCFSGGVQVPNQLLMANILGVPLVGCHERYLGMLSFAGRNKQVLFQALVDRVWSKIKGWKNKLLAVGGKEILIKAVIQSIPAFSMNLFKLPLKLIRDLHRLASRFWWWDSSQASRKIHWCKWEVLCKNQA